MATVNPPRGMRDFLPQDMVRRQRILGIIRERYQAHGFDEIETPVLEDYGRLHAGIGGDNEKLSFSILKRGLSPEQIIAAATDQAELADLGLRYDLTVPLARFYASHRAELPGVFRAIQIAPVWRAERPQKGRYRQFVQCDIDIIGDSSSRAEVELMLATVDALEHLGLTGATVRLNDRRLLDAMLNAFGFAEAERASVLITIDKLDKIGADGVAAELRERGSSEPAVAKLVEYLAGLDQGEIACTANAIRSALPAGMPEEVILGLGGLQEAVHAALSSGKTAGASAVQLVFDPFLVRGMGYYTGTIYELAHPSVGYSLGGGGRYDGMIGRFLGTEVPAVGFSLGFERLVELLPEVSAERAASVVLIHDRDVPYQELFAHKMALLQQASRVRIEQRPKNLKNLLERAVLDGYAAFTTVAAGQSECELRPLV